MYQLNGYEYHLIRKFGMWFGLVYRDNVCIAEVVGGDDREDAKRITEIAIKGGLYE